MMLMFKTLLTEVWVLNSNVARYSVYDNVSFKFVNTTVYICVKTI